MSLDRSSQQSFIRRLWVGVLSVCISMPTLVQPSLAQPTSQNQISDDQLASYRYHYDQAKKALKKNQNKTFEKHFSKLDGYPLKQYLEYGKLKKTLGQLDYEEIDRFLVDHDGTFLADRLRSNLLILLAIRGKWESYLNYHQAEFDSTAMQCNTIYANYKTGEEDVLYNALPLWDVGRSQPKSCNKLFKLIENKDLISDELRWSRFNKAMQARKRSLANYVAKKLEGKRKNLADLYQKVDRNPNLIKKSRKFTEQSLEMQQVIAHGIKKLARKKPLEALYHWEMYQAQQLFPEDLQYDTTLEVFRRLSRKGHSDAVHQLLAYSHDFRDNKLIEEIIREGLEAQDWHQVYDSIMMLSLEDQQTDRWLYWRARAQEELHLETDFPPSREIYESLAKNRSFYGFLSADKLDMPYSLDDASITVDPKLLEVVGNAPGMQRAKELWLTGNMVEARAEWFHTSESMGAGELLAAGQLAQDWGWHNSGIQAMISGNLWDHLTVRFPIAYEQHINHAADRNQMEPTLIYAVARQESAFMENAKSSAGAMGLMQVMPRTARETAREGGFKHRTRDLLDPAHNIKIGSYYLSSLLDKFEGNRILAAAAYNAGPHRVARWLSKEDQERAFDVWIETIPFRETRGYVQNVLSYSVIYAYRLGKTLPLVTEEEAKKPL